MAEWAQAITGFFILLFSGIGAYVKLNNSISQKSDKDIMAKELKDIAVALGKLESGQSEVNEKLDSINEKLEDYIKIITRIDQDLAILKREHELRGERSCIGK